MNNQLYKKVFYSTLVVCLTAASLVVLYQSSDIFLSSLIGVGMAALMHPLIRWMKENWHFSRVTATLLILLGVGSLFLILFISVGSILVDQFNSLKESFPSILEQWEARWLDLARKYPQLTTTLKSSQPSGLAQSLFPVFTSVIGGLTAFATGFSLAAVIAIFTSLNFRGYYSGFTSLFPEESRDAVKDNLQVAGRVLRKWFYAQLLDMAAVFVLTTVGLWIAGVDYFVLFGLMAGILAIIPYIGIVSVILISGAIVLVQQPDHFLPLLIVFFITQQLEGNFILPKLMKDQVETPAALLLFTMILVGSWLGGLGVFVTPPLVAISIALFKKYRTIEPVTK